MSWWVQPVLVGTFDQPVVITDQRAVDRKVPGIVPAGLGLQWHKEISNIISISFPIPVCIFRRMRSLGLLIWNLSDYSKYIVKLSGTTVILMPFSNCIRNEQFPRNTRQARLASLADVIVYQYSLCIGYGVSESHLFRDSVIHCREWIVSTWLLYQIKFLNNNSKFPRFL